MLDAATIRVIVPETAFAGLPRPARAARAFCAHLVRVWDAQSPALAARGLLAWISATVDDHPDARDVRCLVDVENDALRAAIADVLPSPLVLAESFEHAHATAINPPRPQWLHARDAFSRSRAGHTPVGFDAEAVSGGPASLREAGFASHLTRPEFEALTLGGGPLDASDQIAAGSMRGAFYAQASLPYQRLARRG